MTLGGGRVRDHLGEILASPQFSHAPRHSAFLRFVVGAKLDGDHGSIKESVIASQVYGRENYDPAIDSLIRVEASRLRAKLDKYYAGTLSPVRIHLPKGSYVPVFEEGPVPSVLSRYRRFTVVAAAAILLVTGWGAYRYLRHRRVVDLIATANATLPPGSDFSATTKPERGPRALGQVMSSVAMLEQAVAIEPRNASALAGLATGYFKASEFDPKLYAKMESVAQRLLAVAPDSYEPHFFLGYDAFFVRRDNRQAHRYFHRALSLNGKNEILYRYAFLASTAIGRLEEAEALLAKGLKLLPDSSVIALAHISSLLNLERWTDVEQEAARLIRQKPQLHNAHFYLAQAHRYLDRWPDAERGYKTCLEISPGEGTCQANLAFLYHRTGRSREAAGIETEISLRHRDNSHVLLAIASMGVPDYQATLRHLKDGQRSRDLNLPYLGVTTAFKPLRSDPRFQELLPVP